MISIIAALDEKRGIGKDGKLPWHISEDLKRFKSLTMGHPIIMGRKTFESIGQPLPGRYNIVVTTNPAILSGLGIGVFTSIGEAIRQAKSKVGSEEIFIIGGGQVFKEAMEEKLVDKLYLTLVEGDYKCDTFFPDYSEFDKIIYEESRRVNNINFKFKDLKK